MTLWFETSRILFLFVKRKTGCIFKKNLTKLHIYIFNNQCITICAFYYFLFDKFSYKWQFEENYEKKSF